LLVVGCWLLVVSCLIGYWLLVVGCTLLLTTNNYQLPITNYQLPLTITNCQLPITNCQLPITNYQLPITDLRFMAASYSFDIVSDFDRQELVNAVDQTVREIQSRYDLKDTKTTVELSEESINLNTDSEFTLDAVHTILQTKSAKRNLSLKIFDYGKVESASGSRVRQEIKLKKGISQEIAKQINKLIRDEFKKVQSSIQGDSVRVSAKSKDELQLIIQRLKQEDYPVALQFTNYR
jgi:uncharacterized protein YajQ (UPF0234 family)